VLIASHEVKLTNPDKLLFPALGLAKGDLVQYYIDAAPCALPAVSRRPIHVLKYADRPPE
jgi:bifunctional non-homologous end joining protein LigD